jgi:hypothetical protein
MKELYFAELRRFRNAALIFAAAHLLLQLVVGRNNDVLPLRWAAHMVILGVFMVSGLAFGLYQFGTWRHTGRWIWLLHRPLSRRAIFAAVACASVTLIVLAVGLPALAALLATKWKTLRVVDLRHFALVAHLVLLTIMAWLAGACVMLSHSRTAIMILVLPYLVLGHLASSFVMLAPAVACTVFMAFVAYGAFRTDRTAPPARSAVVCATALPLSLGFYLALAHGGGLLYQSIQVAAGTHPGNRLDGGVLGFWSLGHQKPQPAIDGALAASADPRAAAWRRELARAKASEVTPIFRQFPVRDQASNLDVLKWVDPERGIIWTFSHDAMRFQGVDARTGADRGWFGLHGAGDSQPFPEVPMLPRQDWIVTSQHVYEINFANQTTTELIGLSAGERLAMPAKQHFASNLYTLTNQRLLVHPFDFRSAGKKLATSYSVDLPGAFSDLGRVQVAELADGTLLSFIYGRQMMNGGPASSQVLMFVDRAGKAGVVARRELAHEFPLLFEQRDWWISPALQAVAALPEMLIDKGLVLDRGESRYTGDLGYPRPAAVVAAAVLCSLLSALGAWRWLRPMALSARARIAWIGACLLLGLPGLLSLMVLRPRRAWHRYSRAAAVAPVASAPASFAELRTAAHD